MTVETAVCDVCRARVPIEAVALVRPGYHALSTVLLCLACKRREFPGHAEAAP